MQALNDPFATVQRTYQEIQGIVLSPGGKKRRNALAKRVKVLKDVLQDNFPKLVQTTAKDLTSRLEVWHELKKTLRAQNTNKQFDGVITSAIELCRAARILVKFRRAYGSRSPEYHAFVNDFGCDINRTGKSGYTPLTYAVANHQSELVRFLVSLKVDLNKSDAHGYTALTSAVSDGQKDLINLLVELGASVNSSDGKGSTPLVKAVYMGRDDLVELLHSLKAEINKPDKNKYTPLSAAIKSQNLPMIKLLVEKLGANPRLDATGIPLNEGVEIGNIEVVKLLCELGADVNQIDKKSRKSPMQTAIFNNRIDVISYFLSVNAKIDCPDSDGTTLLTYAIWQSQKIVKILQSKPSQIPNETLISDMIILSNIWGLDGSTFHPNGKGNTFDVDLGGARPTIMRRHFLGLLKFFLSTYPSVIPEDKAKILISAFRAMIPIKLKAKNSILNKIKAGNPVIICGGMFDHTLYFVIYKNKLVLCNRGAGFNQFACEFYKLRSGDVTIDLINKLKATYADEDKFLKMVKDLKLQLLFGLKLKDQEAPNCVWANLKAALMAFLYLLFYKKSNPRKKYKKMTCLFRVESLKKYLDKWGNTNPHFLGIIRKKLDEKKGLTEAKLLMADY